MVIGGVAVAGSIATYALDAGHPALAFVGLTRLVYVQVIYPAASRLTVGPDAVRLRNILGTPFVDWEQIGRITSVPALSPAGPVGNQSGLKLRGKAGRLIVIVPDGSEVSRERHAFDPGGERLARSGGQGTQADVAAEHRVGPV